MSNLLTSGLAFNPYFYANSALQVLYKRLGMAFYVNRQLEAEKGSGKGDTIQIRRPQTFSAASMPIAVASFNDVTTQYDNLVINTWKGQGFKLTDKEKTLTPEAFVTDHITPVAVAIADAIDTDLCGLALQCGNTVTTDSSNPYKDFPAIRKSLFDTKAPLVNDADYAYMVDGVLTQRYESDATFVQVNTAGREDLQMNGLLTVKYGFRIFSNQNAPTGAAGTITAGTHKVQTGWAVGDTSVTLYNTTLTGTLKKGNTFTVAGDSQKYAVTADATASGNAITVSICPAIKVTEAGDAVVTVDATASTSNGIAFHRNAYALVMQPLEDAGPGIISATVTDPLTKLTLRSRIGSDFGTGVTIWSIDALWGSKTLDPNLAARTRI